MRDYRTESENAKREYEIVRGFLTHAAVGFFAIMSGIMIGVLAEENDHISQVPKTNIQSFLIDKGVASKATFDNAAREAVDRKTKEFIEANKELIEKAKVTLSDYPAP